MGGLKEKLDRVIKKDRKQRDWVIIFAIYITTFVIFGIAKLFEDSSSFVLSPDTFLAWHILLEFSAIVMAFCIFAITYYTSEETKSMSMVIIACTFLSVTLLDTMHTFTYKGMPYLLTSSSPVKATALWMTSRLVMAIGVAIAYFIPGDKILKKDQGVYALICTILTVLFMVLIGYKPEIFPSMYIEGRGITPLKITLEYLISAILIITAIKLYRIHTAINRDKAYILMVIALIFSSIAEISFTLYDNVYDTYNLLGHLYKFIGQFLLFRALFVINIKKPYKDLSEVEKKLSTYVDDLERSVELRTIEITTANEKLMKNLRDAKQIQKALMTTTFPRIPGMEFAAMYLPCEQVGGDFYNVFRLDEQNVGIVIGDVAGHGVSAAMVNVFINQNMRYRVDYDENKYRILTPRGVLSNLYHTYNKMSFPEEMYVVLFYGIYNIETGKLSYSSAGMNTYPIILKANGETSCIKLDGFPICKFGKFYKPSYETKTMFLEPEDTLIFYSDGLGEIDRKRPNLFSTKNIMEYIKGMEDYSAQDICHGLSDAYYTLLSDKEMLDDVTILVIKTPDADKIY